MNNLKKYRKAAGLSQQNLAYLIDSSQNTISTLESGRWDPTLKNAYKLSAALRIPIEELFPDGYIDWKSWK